MPLTANISVYATGRQTSALDLGTANVPFSIAVEHALTDGTTTGKADRVFADTRTLGPSATENLDLAGVLLDFFGAVLTFVTIKAIIIKAAAGNTNDVQLSRPASNGFPLFLAAGDAISIRPGGVFVWTAPAAGITVTPTTGDLLTVTNGAAGTSVSYDIEIIGTSA